MPHSQRYSRSQQPLGMVALKFIRMMIASYFVLVSLGQIRGFDPSVLLKFYLDEDSAVLIGSTAVLVCGCLLFFGLFLRFASLCLAILVLSSSIFTNLMAPGSVDSFIQDLLVICGLLLGYCTLSEREIRNQAFVVYKHGVRKFYTDRKVFPKRITSKAAQSPYSGTAKAFDPPLSGVAVAPIRPVVCAPFQRTSVARTSLVPELHDAAYDDCKNIFA